MLKDLDHIIEAFSQENDVSGNLLIEHSPFIEPLVRAAGYLWRA